MAYNCFVRVYLPVDSNGKPQPSLFGHFDLQIDSADGKTGFPFDSHTSSMLHPVISYRGYGNTGFVKIFDAKDVDDVFTNNYLLCRYHFTASSNKIVSFTNSLRSMLTYRSIYSSTNVPTYEVTSGPFQNYSDSLYNAFGATAIWCNSLGMDALYNIYTSSAAQQDHTTYAAWALFDQLFKAWQFTDLNR